MLEAKANSKRDKARQFSRYNPDNLKPGGPELIEEIKLYLTQYKAYLLRARDIIKWFENHYSDDHQVFRMDSLLWAMESDAVAPGTVYPTDLPTILLYLPIHSGIEEMLATIPDEKKHKPLINSFKIMMKVLPRCNLKRYQACQEYGKDLVMFETRCQTLFNRCAVELAQSNKAQQKHWLESTERKRADPTEVNYDAELQLKVTLLPTIDMQCSVSSFVQIS